MSSRRSVRQLLVAVLLGVLVGGGLMAVTPAGAEVSQAVATNWKKIWKKNLRPLADKRYYTKAQSNTKYATKVDSDAKYQPKGSYETAGSGYSKAESDAKYSAAGSSYSKTESDAKYAPVRPLYQGTWMLGGTNSAATHYTTSVSFGANFSAAPTTHYIKSGGILPAGCSGTAANPNASPGHLCVFEGYVGGASWAANRGICNSTGNCSLANTYGAAIYAYTTGAMNGGEIMGSWAARPLAVANPARVSPGADAGAGAGSSQ